MKNNGYYQRRGNREAHLIGNPYDSQIIGGCKMAKYILLFSEKVGIGGRHYTPNVKFKINKEDHKYLHIGNDKIDKRILRPDDHKIGEIINSNR